MDGLDGYPQTHPSIGNPVQDRVMKSALRYLALFLFGEFRKCDN